MKVLGICGSLRKASLNMAALRACRELMPQGMTLEIAEIGDIPMFNQDLFDAGLPEPAKRFRAAVTAADGVLIASPEYNFSLTPALKNAIDWASRPPHGDAALWGKTVAVAGATTGQYGALWAQQDLRRILGIAGARVIEGELPVARAQNAFDATGRLTDALVAERLEAHLESLALEAAPIPVAA